MCSDRVDIEGTFYCIEPAQLPVIENLASRVSDMRRSGRLTPEVLGRIRRYFRIKNIYHSNAIEGNILNIGETRQVVEMGLTLTGIPLRDQAEAKNLSAAVDYLEKLATSPDVPITESDIKQIHTLVLKDIDDKNAGAYRVVQVEISGSDYKPPEPPVVIEKMEEFSAWLEEASLAQQDLSKVILNSAVAHTWFVTIHPFIDGNGRVARLLMNLLLMRNGFPIAIITKEDRRRYYDSLEESQASDLSPFVALLVECVHESLEEYEDAAREQREMREWAASLAAQFSEKELARYTNQYEVWRSAMDLLQSYFRQMAELLDQSSTVGRIYFKDFGSLAFEKYLSLRKGESAKKTWFFRIDFKQAERTARYLFFFGSPSYTVRDEVDVTLYLAREDPMGSYHYELLDKITAPNVPNLCEIGYVAKKEKFLTRELSGSKNLSKIEKIGKKFFDDVISKHFSS
jgi:Fic family protein